MLLIFGPIAIVAIFFYLRRRKYPFSWKALLRALMVVAIVYRFPGS
jgi:hypothetical protein